jgi:phage-related protein
MLHSFVKKTQKTPEKELKIAKLRMKELKKWRLPSKRQQNL